jgi:zinc-ribbon domain
MAGFCTKCGATLSDETAFCTKCGAPVAATAEAAATPAASNAPAYTPPATYATPASTYAPVSSTHVGTAAAPVKGGSALKIILIIVAVFVGLGVLSVAGVMFGLWRISKVVHVSQNGGGAISVNTPGGTFSAGNTTVSASDLGVDLYPGATQQKGAVRISTPNGTAITAIYETSDPLEKVVDFYKGKLGSGASVFESDKSAVLTLNSADKKDSVMVTIGTDDSDGKTTISILHSKSS